MHEESMSELYDIYLAYNKNFLIANPEVRMSLPSLEGFEFTMNRLPPEERNKLVTRWKMGWQATQHEINLKLSRINLLTKDGLHEFEQFMKEINSHVKFM